MPIREFRCTRCRKITEVIHPSLNPGEVPVPECRWCKFVTELMVSCPRIDTSSTFKSFTWRGPTGIYHEISNLNDLRKVEHAYLETGHNVRFDAYSSNEHNPDPVDGFGPEYRTGEPDEEPRTKTVDLGAPTV